MNAFLEAPNRKKMLTLSGIYVGLVSQLVASSTFSGILRVAQTQFDDGSLWVLAASISGVLGLIAMPLYGFFGARNPALKATLVMVSLLLGLLVLIGRALAPNMISIVVVSAFWGFVSAGLYVLGFSMVRDMFPQEKSGTYLGLLGTMISLGMLAGPVLGGAIMQSPLGWRGLNVILAVAMGVALALVFLGLRVKKDEVAELASTTGSFDPIGTLGLMMLLGGLIVMLSMTAFFPFGSLVSNILIAVAVVGLVILVVDIIKKGDGAIIPKKVFGDMTSVTLALVILISNFTSLALIYFLPQYIPTLTAADPIAGAIDPSHTGLSLMLPTACLAIAGLFLGPVFGKAIARSGNTKNVILLGTVVQMVVIAGFFLLFVGVLGKGDDGVPVAPYWIILALMLIAGIYNSRTAVVNSTGAQIQVRPEIRVQSNSVIQVGQNLGAGVAIPVFGAIQAAYAAPLVASGTAATQAGIQALTSAMPVVMAVSFVPLLVLAGIAFLLKPLPKSA
jgi:MFS family permease